MGTYPEKWALRHRMIGLLVREARQRMGMSAKACAQMLGCSTRAYLDAEYGRKGFSLAQLEALAEILRIPLDTLLAGVPPLPQEDIAERVTFRRRMIGVLLRQARQEANKTIKECAAFLGCSPSKYSRYEYGEIEIPIAELEALADFLGVSMEHFQVTPTEQPPLSWEELPEDIREFVSQPANALYLRVAINLSKMPADTLRQIASGLLEITY